MEQVSSPGGCVCVNEFVWAALTVRAREIVICDASCG